MNDPKPQIPDDELLALERGAEPYWMQDIRLAVRRLEAQRSARSTPAELGGKTIGE